jgi:DNA mismatch endonuclease (patch repair protein)
MSEGDRSWASSEGVRRSMQSNRPRDTRPEVALRSALHAAGLRFRKHYRPVKGSRCEVDVAFTRWKVAVQFDGCFWHGCPQHATRPATNEAWWAAKLDANIARDRRNDELLTHAGWKVLRFWEHEQVDHIVATVREAVTSEKLAEQRGRADPGRETPQPRSRATARTARGR